MEAHKIQTVVTSDRKVDVSALPLEPGESVEVIILHQATKENPRSRESFRGSVLRFDRPLDPIFDENEFDAIRDPDSVINPNRNQ